MENGQWEGYLLPDLEDKEVKLILWKQTYNLPDCTARIIVYHYRDENEPGDERNYLN